jgi:ATP-dependent Clp protease ATP-binding subunit ClpC
MDLDEKENKLTITIEKGEKKPETRTETEKES